jgi:hypothetical protein
VVRVGDDPVRAVGQQRELDRPQVAVGAQAPVERLAHQRVGGAEHDRPAVHVHPPVEPGAAGQLAADGVQRDGVGIQTVRDRGRDRLDHRAWRQRDDQPARRARIPKPVPDRIRQLPITVAPFSARCDRAAGPLAALAFRLLC